jgi:hypothetical protein
MFYPNTTFIGSLRVLKADLYDVYRIEKEIVKLRIETDKDKRRLIEYSIGVIRHSCYHYQWISKVMDMQIKRLLMDR